jgi:hypothetical protein
MSLPRHLSRDGASSCRCRCRGLAPRLPSPVHQHRCEAQHKSPVVERADGPEGEQPAVRPPVAPHEEEHVGAMAHQSGSALRFAEVDSWKKRALIGGLKLGFQALKPGDETCRARGRRRTVESPVARPRFSPGRARGSSEAISIGNQAPRGDRREDGSFRAWALSLKAGSSGLAPLRRRIVLPSFSLKARSVGVTERRHRTGRVLWLKLADRL